MGKNGLFLLLTIGKKRDYVAQQKRERRAQQFSRRNVEKQLPLTKATIIPMRPICIKQEVDWNAMQHELWIFVVTKVYLS